MGNRAAFAPGEWYHCYARGIDKRTVFEDRADYERFQEMLYLANAASPAHRSNISKNTAVYGSREAEPLVSIGAYALMPNHFHILILETGERGISTFLQKLLVAYTMYFNIKRGRSGGLFTRPFRSRHVGDDRYLQWCVDYIHMNPVAVVEPGFNATQDKNYELLQSKLLDYPYSSYRDLVGNGSARDQNLIVGDQIKDVYREKLFPETVDAWLNYQDNTLIKG